MTCAPVFRLSRARFDAELVAAACVFLATKDSEQIRRIRDVINIFYAERESYEPGSIVMDQVIVCA